MALPILAISSFTPRLVPQSRMAGTDLFARSEGGYTRQLYGPARDIGPFGGARDGLDLVNPRRGRGHRQGSRYAVQPKIV